MQLSLKQIVEEHSATLLSGSLEQSLTGLASLADAQTTDLSFLGEARYRNMVTKSQAGAILVSEEFKPKPTESGQTFLALADPAGAFTKLIEQHLAARPLSYRGQHSTAVVSEEAHVDPSATLAAHCVIEAGAVIHAEAVIGAGSFVGQNALIGQGTELAPQVVIGDGCEVGKNCLIHSGAVIGADGFGYEFKDGKHVKIPQLGNVIIEDDCEIGANTCIDRARFGTTRIGQGTKIDNQVQIGHNCNIGKHNIICGQTGMAGSCIIGDYSTLAAQVGLSGHLSIAPQTTIAARGGVISDIETPGETYAGFPAQSHANWRKQIAATTRLPKLRTQVQELKSQLAQLQQQLAKLSESEGEAQ